MQIGQPHESVCLARNRGKGGVCEREVADVCNLGDGVGKRRFVWLKGRYQRTIIEVLGLPCHLFAQPVHHPFLALAAPTAGWVLRVCHAKIVRGRRKIQRETERDREKGTQIVLRRREGQKWAMEELREDPLQGHCRTHTHTTQTTRTPPPEPRIRRQRTTKTLRESPGFGSRPEPRRGECRCQSPERPCS